MKKLSKLEPSEVSLVPKGANKKKFLIFKALDSEETMPKTAEELLDLISKVDPKVMENVTKALDEQETNPKLQAALKAVVRILTPFKEEISEDLLESVFEEAGLMVEPENAGSPGEGEAGEDHGVKPEHMKEAMVHAEKMFKEHLAKLGYQKYPTAEMKLKSAGKPAQEPKEENVSKTAILKEDGSLDLAAVPEEMRPAVELIFKSNQELVKKSADLEKQLKEERDQRVEKEFDAKANSFKNIGGDKKELAKVLKTLHATDPKAYETIEKELRAADEQIAKGKLFAEIGSSLSAKVGSAEAKIDAAVNSLVEKSTGLTKEQAYEKFLTTPEGQELYKQMKSERPGGI